VAGILAPQISGIGSANAPQGGVASGPSALGSALDFASGVLGSIDAPDGDSQTDRDRAALKPWFEEAQRIKDLEDGGLGFSQAEVLWRNHLVKGITAFPDMQSELREGAGLIRGIDLRKPEQNIANEQADAEAAYFATSEGEFRALEAIVTNPLRPGQTSPDINHEATAAKRTALYAEAAGRAANLAFSKQQLEILQTAGEAGKEGKKLLLDDFTRNNYQASAATVKGLMDLFAGQPVTPDTITSGILQITDLRNKAAIVYGGYAVDAGIAGLSEYNASLALEPYENTLALLTALQGSDAANLAQTSAQAGRDLTAVIKGAGLLPTGPLLDYAAEAMVHQEGGVKILKFLSEWVNAPKVATDGMAAITPDLAGVVSPEFVAQVNELSDFEKIEVTKGYLGAFFSFEGYTGDDPAQREEAVQMFGRAVGVISSTGKLPGAELVQKMLSPDFVTIYNKITEVDDETSQMFKDATGVFFNTTLNQRVNLAAFRMNNNFGSDYPTAAIRFDGSKYVFSLGEQSLSPQGRALGKTLHILGLTRDEKGLRAFASSPGKALEAGVSISDKTQALNLATTILGTVTPELKVLNRIHEIGVQLPGIEDSLPAKPAVTVDLPNDDDGAAWEGLKVGDRYRITLPDGTTVETVKGSAHEQSLRDAEEDNG